MPTLPLHLAPGLLVLFMVALAVVPLLIVVLDDRRRERDAARLERLRDEARLCASLARRAALQSAAARPGVRLPNA